MHVPMPNPLLLSLNKDLPDRSFGTANHFRQNKTIKPKHNMELLNDKNKTQKLHSEFSQFKKINDGLPKYTLNINDDTKIRFGSNSYRLATLLDAQMNLPVNQ